MNKSDFTPAASVFEHRTGKPAPNDCPLMMNHDYTGKKCPTCDFIMPQKPSSESADE